MTLWGLAAYLALDLGVLATYLLASKWAMAVAWAGFALTTIGFILNEF